MDNASVYEVLQLAITMEEEGQKFYEKHAVEATGEVKNVLLKLAIDEVAHAKYFKALYDELEKSVEQDYLFDEEVVVFFQEYAKSAAFNKKEIIINSTRDVIQVGITTEKNTISYYEKIGLYAIGYTGEMLKRLIEEEKSHKKLLEDLLETLE